MSGFPVEHASIWRDERHRGRSNSSVPLQQVTIRMSEHARWAIALEAQHAGLSLSEFVREAALVRAAILYARREGSGVELLDELSKAARRFHQEHLGPPEQ